MLSGDSTQRTSSNLGNLTQQCYRCYTAENYGGSMYSPCMDPKLDTDHLPKQPCAGGIRSNIIFPLYIPNPVLGTYLLANTASDAGTGRTWTAPTTKTTSRTRLVGPRPSPWSAASALAAIR
jgi:hypothetical protein